MNSIFVEKTVTCQRCGEPSLAWMRSKNGKAYLVKARQCPDGAQFEARRNDFHSCPNSSTTGAAKPLSTPPAGAQKTPPAPLAPNVLSDILARLSKLETEVARLRR